MAITAEMARQYRGRSVYCHSAHGFYRGMLAEVQEHGIFLTHTLRLSGPVYPGADIADHRGMDETDGWRFFPVPVPVPTPVVPAGPGGLYVPYAGMYGLYPVRPGVYW